LHSSRDLTFQNLTFFDDFLLKNREKCIFQRRNLAFFHTQYENGIKNA
jgi:hypothetical protein